MIVGESRSGTPFSDNIAIPWTETSGMVNLGSLPGGAYQSVAEAVSADGTITVGQADTQFGSEAFRSNGTGMTGIEMYKAWDVSGDGSIIIGYNGNSASIWDRLNGSRNLKDVLVSDYGLDLTGWNLTEAIGISDDGLTIVGNGINPDGQHESWIFVVPEPALLLLFGLGGLVLRLRRER